MAHFFTFFEIYKIFTLSHRSELKISRKFIIFVKILRIFRNFANFVEISRKSQRNLLKFCVQSGAKVWKSCRSRKIWKNAPFLAIVAVDTAENEFRKEWCVVARPRAARARRPPPAVRAALREHTSLFSRHVLGCIETKFCNQIRIFSGFSRSTKLSSWFFEKVANSCKKSQNFAKFLRNFRIFAKNVLIFAKIADF